LLGGFFERLFYIFKLRSDKRRNVERYFRHRISSLLLLDYRHYTIINRIFLQVLLFSKYRHCCFVFLL
jgi:hypothetical protein